MQQATSPRRRGRRIASRVGGLVVLSAAVAALAPATSSAAGIDFDRDGLGHLEERLQYGTDPWNSDTDRDRLGDGDEVKKYKTNPKKKDTDGDGAGDGAEVERGSDPLDRTHAPVRIDSYSQTGSKVRATFSHPQPGTKFTCRLDAYGYMEAVVIVPPQPCTSPVEYDLANYPQVLPTAIATFSVTATETDGDTSSMSNNWDRD